jgi:hypothetical protein
MFPFGLALLSAASAAPVTIELFVAPPGATVQCVGHDPVEVGVRVELQGYSGTKCKVTGAQTGASAEFAAIDKSVWSCALGDAGSCERMDVPPKRAAPRSAAKPEESTAGPPSPPSYVPGPAFTARDLDKAFADYASLPNPAAAAALSGFVGFGAGHFYAGDMPGGTTFLLLESAALLAAGAGFAVDDPQTQAGVIVGAAVAHVALRLIDVGSAPAAAHRAADRRYRRR